MEKTDFFNISLFFMLYGAKTKEAYSSVGGAYNGMPRHVFFRAACRFDITKLVIQFSDIQWLRGVCADVRVQHDLTQSELKLHCC